MEKGKMIIADRDADYRNRLAELFRKGGYQVETSGSVPRLLQSVLCQGGLVLLLDSDLDQRVPAPELMHLLKKCHRDLRVILMSDQITLPLARKVREEGLFYHALRPPVPEECEELALAVAAAFGKSCAVDILPRPRWESAGGAAPAERSHRTLLWTMVLSSICASGVAVAAINGGFPVTMSLFAGFSALILVSQLLPIFRIQLPSHWYESHRKRGSLNRNSTGKGGIR